MAQVGRLHGKVAVVTGAASGIGKAVCERFLAEGSRVMMVDRNKKTLEDSYQKLNDKYNHNVTMIECNVVKETAASETFSATKSHFGQNCNVLINSAGGGRDSSIVKTSTSDFNFVVGMNLNSVFTFTREFLLRLELGSNKKSEDASIVNIASLAGKMGMSHLASYAAAKAGVVAFTKSTCIETARYGVRCNALLPGFIETPILDDINKAYLEASLHMNPMRRFGKPVEVANACLFLASDESSYVNGASLEITGGLMA